MLAQATTPNHVLDAWIQFRYRQPKRIHHFMRTLKRLVEVGGCEASDWRLQVLLSRLRGGYKRVINYDILLKYFSDLRLYNEIEQLTKFVKPHIPLLKPGQLVSIMKSYGTCQLRDTAMLGLCMRYLGRDHSALSTKDLISIVSSLGGVEIRSTHLISLILSELLKRELTIDQFCDLISAARSARYRDYALAELAVLKGRKVLDQKERRNWDQLCRLVHELNLSGIDDVTFCEEIISVVDPDSVSLESLIALVSASVGIVETDSVLNHFNVIRDSVILIEETSQILLVASSVDRAKENLPFACDLLVELGARLVDLPRESETYNVASLAEIFHKNQIYPEKLWKALLSDTRICLPDFEPNDFLTAARTFAELPPELLGKRFPAVSNELCEWALKRWEEFGLSQWNELKEILLSKERFACSDWAKHELDKWGEVIAKSKKSQLFLNRYRNTS